MHLTMNTNACHVSQFASPDGFILLALFPTAAC